MIEEYFTIAVQSLRRRKLRSWLTLLGIFIGIAAVVALISLGEGMQQSIVGEFEALGGDKLFVQADTVFGSVGEGSSSNPLTLDDVEFLKTQSGVASVTYYVFSSAQIEYRDVTKYYLVIGVPTGSPEEFKGYFSLWTAPVYQGRNIEINDKFTAVLGWQHANRQLWDGQNVNLDDKVFINGQAFRAGGFYEAVGSSSDDQTITITDTAYEQVIGKIDRVDAISITVLDENKLEETSEQLSRNLARFRGVNEDNKDFTIQTPLELLASFQTILDIVQAVLIGIAAISLFVGGIGIMNTMYTAVLERRKDIGIMKAIGARNKDIFYLFLFESGLLGLVGGIIGIIIGSGLAWMVEIISAQALGKTFLVAYFSWELFLAALLFSFLVGALAGTLPALQAAKEQAADTLRDE